MAIGVEYLNLNLSLSSETVIAGNAQPCVTVFGDSLNQQVVVAWYDGAAVSYAVYDYGLATVVQDVTAVETLSDVVNITGHAISNAFSWFTLFYTVSNATKSKYVIRKAEVVDYALITPAQLVRSVGLAGKAFVCNFVFYVVAAFDSSSEQGLQNTYFIIDQDGDAVARIISLNGGGQPSRSQLPEVNTVG